MFTFQRPNVLIIYTDQQRRDTLGCYGQEAVPTPNIDALAAGGVRMDQCYVQSPICGPSRASFLTGRYCSSLHIGTNGIKVPQELQPIQKLLKPYGYHTAQIGKLHFDPHARRDHRDPVDSYGFDTFILSDEPGCYDDAYTKWVECIAPGEVPNVRTKLPPAALTWGKPSYSDHKRNTHEPYLFDTDAGLTHTAFVTSETCRYLRSRRREEPFLAIAGYFAPHPPINPPKEYVDRVDRSKITFPKRGEKEPLSSLLEGISDQEWIEIRAHYLAMVAQIDDGVGEILQTLKDQGLYDNTIIIYTSDHGEFLGDHGRIQKWMPGQRAVTNVPCILHYPKKIDPKETDTLVESVDILPTLLDLCGIQTPTDVQGKSLLPYLKGEEEEHRTSALTELFAAHSQRQSTIHTRDYMYYLGADYEEMLFDLKKDPMELENVSQDPAYEKILGEMRFLMLQRVRDAAYHGIPKIDEY